MKPKRMIPAIHWKPDKTTAIPLYSQIVRFICDRIAAGDWAVGMVLPSQRQLATIFDVNRSTIVTAMTELTGDGILETDHGAGTRVASNTWPLLIKESVDWSTYMAGGVFKDNLLPVQAINRYEADQSMIRLGTGELSPELFPAAMWRKALAVISETTTSLGYVEPLGMVELRNALSVYLQHHGITAPPSCILITSGALQALHLISLSMLRPGSTVYTEAPTYLKSLQLFQSVRQHLEGIPLDTEGLQYWRLPTKTNASASSKSILYTIPTNHNPTGITMSVQRRQELVEFCTRCQLPIIEDDAYGPLYFGHTLPPSLKSFDTNGGVIYIGTASKSLAAGLRLGWVVAPEAIVQRLGDVKMQMDYGASSVSQLLFTEFLTSGMYEEYTAMLRKELQNRRDNALAALARYFSDIAVWNVPMGGFYIWVTLQVSVPMDVLFRRAAQEGLLLNPGDIYDFYPNRSLRISYSYVSCDMFTEGIHRLAVIISDLAASASKQPLS
jgi:GntR family transcriptional regulator of abcA and norABC